MAEENDLTPYWDTALASLTEEELPAQQRAFVTLTQPLGLVGDTALVAAPNDFTKDVLETRLRPIVVRALTDTIGQDIRLAVTVDPSLTPPVDDDVTDQMADATYADDAPSVAPENGEAQPVRDEAAARPGTGSPDTRSGDGRLNDKY
ncbi:MAG: chromosomal replication initiator protein DnaA, partial [Actinomycetota bacterium]|nr:chromosomal replication initiator protein DnaA [Actinomycetota bacterium]